MVEMEGGTLQAWEAVVLIHTGQGAGHVLGMEINQGGVWVWKQEKDVDAAPL